MTEDVHNVFNPVYEKILIRCLEEFILLENPPSISGLSQCQL